MVTSFQLSYGMLSDHSVDHRYLSLHVFRCFVAIEDDYILLSKICEWGCAIHFFMSGVMLWVRDGVATILTTLIIRSSDTKYVDQCVTLTPSSFVSPEQPPLVSGLRSEERRVGKECRL